MKKLGDDCPDCGSSLHKGQHKFEDGFYFVNYCKQCGFRDEKPLAEREHIKHLKQK